MNKKPKIIIYDTTLRDGTQGEGISFSVSSKLRLTKSMDQFGVDYIEGGWPGSNPRDMEYFEAVKGIKFSVPATNDLQSPAATKSSSVLSFRPVLLLSHENPELLRGSIIEGSETPKG